MGKKLLNVCLAEPRCARHPPRPAQKWLKDRKSRTLAFEDIWHYQKIIKALAMTDEIMKEIDDGS